MRINELLNVIEEGDLNEGQRDPDSPRYMCGQILGHLKKAQQLAVKLEVAASKDSSGMRGLDEMRGVATVVRNSLKGSGLSQKLIKVSHIFKKDKSLSKAERLQFSQGKVDAFNGLKG
tara:strand:+ start:907 stop:1260 length:354 start_codon:yes stop_codon:yes gene_type:complete